MLPTCGERSGEEGAGDDDETPESPAEIDVARCGSKPYLGGVIVIYTFTRGTGWFFNWSALKND